MYKRFMVLCAFMLFVLPFSAFALSESEYRELLKDSEFAAVDQEFKQVWSEAKKNLSPDEFDKLKESQREWVKNVRDESAEELIDFQGYSKVMAYIAVTNDRIKAIRDMFGASNAAVQTTKPTIQTGIEKADKDYITVIAEGYAENKQKALESAYIDAVRLAVGAIISAKTELNNDELSESIIMHSRGVIEGFDVLDERNEGGSTRLHIRARVHREILQDETKRYIEAQTVKADVQGVVKAQMDEHAKEVTTQAKQKSGAELLREVLDSYEPQDFFSATLNPKIFYDKKTKKPYVQITEKFNQSVFWDDFLPKLRNALDGVSAKKMKRFYDDNVRKVNQRLLKEGFQLFGGMGGEIITGEPKEKVGGNTRFTSYTYRDMNTRNKPIYFPYQWWEIRPNRFYQVIIPNDNASLTIYEMPFQTKDYEYTGDGYREFYTDINIQNIYTSHYSIPPEGSITKLEEEMLSAFFKFIQKMCRPVTYEISYFDKDRKIITKQIIRTGPRAFGVYRTFQNSVAGHIPYLDCLIFAPGYMNGDAENPVYVINSQGKNHLFLGTGNYNLAHPNEGYTVELDPQDLQKLDSMKFEVIFEQ